jgi:hypothetical protein
MLAFITSCKLLTCFSSTNAGLEACQASLLGRARALRQVSDGCRGEKVSGLDRQRNGPKGSARQNQL